MRAITVVRKNQFLFLTETKGKINEKSCGIHHDCILFINFTTIFNCVHFLDQRSNVIKYLTVSWTGRRFQCTNFASFELWFFGGEYWRNSHPLMRFTNCVHRQWWHTLCSNNMYMNQKRYQCWALCWEGLVSMVPRRVLPIMAYTGRFHPKGVPFSVFRYMKGKGFHQLNYIKG